MVDVLPCDITTLPHILGSDLIEYLTACAENVQGTAEWDPFTEAARIVDPSTWYTMSLDARPGCSTTRWLPPPGSGLATVIALSQAAETTVLIRHDSRSRSPRAARNENCPPGAPRREVTGGSPFSPRQCPMVPDVPRSLPGRQTTPRSSPGGRTWRP